MARKSTKQAQERVVLFPMEEAPELVPLDVTNLSIGAVVRLGRPSNRYYQYVHGSLDFGDETLEDLAKLAALEGTLAKVIGMVQLKKSADFAVLAPVEGASFFEEKARLFMDKALALQHKEIIIEQLHNP